MSAPWPGDLTVKDRRYAVAADGRIYAEGYSPSQTEALVHRANAYPKLVEALEEIAEREHADSCALVMTDGASSCTCHVVIALEAIAAMASTREEG